MKNPAKDLICSGIVPQHPPIILINPFSHNSLKVILRNFGSLTSGEIDKVWLVGPITPAIKRG